MSAFLKIQSPEKNTNKKLKNHLKVLKSTFKVNNISKYSGFNYLEDCITRKNIFKVTWKLLYLIVIRPYSGRKTITKSRNNSILSVQRTLSS